MRVDHDMVSTLDELRAGPFAGRSRAALVRALVDVGLDVARSPTTRDQVLAKLARERSFSPRDGAAPPGRSAAPRTSDPAPALPHRMERTAPRSLLASPAPHDAQGHHHAVSSVIEGRKDDDEKTTEGHPSLTSG
jgi:hypothetical protein